MATARAMGGDLPARISGFDRKCKGKEVRVSDVLRNLIAKSKEVVGRTPAAGPSDAVRAASPGPRVFRRRGLHCRHLERDRRPIRRKRVRGKMIDAIQKAAIARGLSHSGNERLRRRVRIGGI
jgi:hypothetical protein